VNNPLNCLSYTTIHGRYTPMAISCLFGSALVLEMLILEGGNPNTRCLERPILKMALHSPVCMEILLSNGANVDALSCSAVQCSAVQYYCSLDEHSAGVTSLWLAAGDRVCGYGIETIQLLVKYGADIDFKSNRGNSTIDMARQEGNYVVVKYLEKEQKWRRRRAWANIFSSIKHVNSDTKIMKVMQCRDLAGVIASYL
jgi:ankyrin repeat protein